MRLQIGNKVAVLDDVIKGEVVAICNDDISVKTADMTYTFKTNELVKIEVEQAELTKFSDINNPLLQQKQQVHKKRKIPFKKTKKEIVMEVDLHIEKLVKSTKNMDNFTILNYQIETAKRKLEYCIKKRIPKLIFIHGVGAGVLKTELSFLLKKYPVTYSDASYHTYGLGATEVRI